MGILERESVPKEARKCSAAQGPHSEVVLCAFWRLVSKSYDESKRSFARGWKVMTNASVPLQEVVRQNSGHIEHVLHYEQFSSLWGLILYQMSNAFVIIKMFYMYNQWYDISCATLYIVVCSTCRCNGLNFVTSARLGWIMLPRWLADGILHMSKVPISKQSPSRSDWRLSPEPCVLLWDQQVSCSDNYIQDGYKLKCLYLCIENTHKTFFARKQSLNTQVFFLYMCNFINFPKVHGFSATSVTIGGTVNLLLAHYCPESCIKDTQ